MVVDEVDPLAAHEITELLEGVGLALELVGSGVVEDKGNLLEVGGAEDVTNTINIHVPDVGVDIETGIGVVLGEVPPAGVLLPVSGKCSGALPLDAKFGVSRAADEGLRDANVGVVRVEGSDLLDLCIGQVDTGEVALKFLISVDALFAIRGALVEVVAKQERDVSKFALLEQLLSLGSHEVMVKDSAEAGRSDVQRSSAVEHIVEFFGRHLTEAVQVVSCIGASSTLNKSVEVRLPDLGVDELGDRATTLEDSTLEQVVKLAVVSDELHAQRACTCGFAPSSDSVRATTEGLDVLLDPFEGKTLVSESNVASTSFFHLLAEEEAPVRETVVDGHTDKRLVLLDGLVNDVGEVVPGVGRGAGYVALSK